MDFSTGALLVSFDCLSIQQQLFPDFVDGINVGHQTHASPGEAPEMADPDKLRRIHFAAASEFWLATRKPLMKPRSFYNLESNVRQLNKYFGPKIVGKIHLGDIREYQRKRTINEGGLWERTAGPSIIGHEIVALQGVLTRAEVWARIKPHYEALPIPPPKNPKVLTDEEEIKFFAIVASNPDWELALWVAWITEMTSAAGSELRFMKIGHLYLEARNPAFEIATVTAKNAYRGRIVVLNDTALKYVQLCLERANSKGAYLPDHYLFPGRRLRERIGPWTKKRKPRGKLETIWDPTKPASASWLRKQWEGIRKAVGISWLTPHCFRHQHATISLEANESEFMVAKRMGHRNPAMLRKVYGHARQDTQKAAVDAIDPSVRFGPKRVEVPQKMHLVK